MTIQESQRLKHWETYMCNEEYIIASAIAANNQIYNLHCEMKELEIPHLFFNAIRNFDTDHNNVTLPVFEFAWDDCFFHPYNESMSMRQWCLDKKYNQITIGRYHFDVEAQQAWAKLLTDYITGKILSNKA